MAEYENNSLFEDVKNMEASPQFDGYSGVEIIQGEEQEPIFEGSRAGRVLTIHNAWGTREQARNILSSLEGYQYQPLEIGGAIISPAAEIGDGVTARGFYTGVYGIKRTHTALMSADISAPQDEEVDHEFPYEQKQNREYKRELKETRAAITLTASQIMSEVTSLEEATIGNGPTSLASRITQNAGDITAKVDSSSGTSSSSFGWALTSSEWRLFKSGNQTILRATSDGVEVTGKITATSGYIGTQANGFTITASSIYNGMDNLNSDSTGIYIGTNGISLGGGKFKVTSYGSVFAQDMELSGTLRVGGETIEASRLRIGAAQSYSNYGGWNTARDQWNSATQSGGGYISIFRCGALYGDSLYQRTGYGSVQFDHFEHKHSFSVNGGKVYIGAPVTGTSSPYFNIADTQFYRDGVSAVSVSSVTVSSSPTTIYPNRVKVDVTLTNGKSSTFYRSP